MFGGDKGTNLTRQHSHCNWVVKATCGSPGFLISEANTKMNSDASYTLYVVEYSDEFTKNASTPITLEDEVWLPRDLDHLEYYEDSGVISGEPENIDYVDADGVHQTIAGAVIIAMNTWTESTYTAYAKDKNTYNAARAAYLKDPTANRPTALPWIPAESMVPIITNTMFTKGYGKTTSQKITSAMVGKSFGVTAGTVWDRGEDMD